jgi:hypothetical protein
MLLLYAIGVLTMVVIIGGLLGGQYLLIERPPAGLRWPGILHGLGGVAGFVLMVAGLRGPLPFAKAARMGAGAFGAIAGALIAGALVAGLTILLTHVRRRPISPGLVALHGMLAIVGYTLLLTYLTMLH